MGLELPVIGTLPESWDVVPFGEVLAGGTRNGIYKKKEFHGRGAKIVNMGELFGHPRLFDVEMKRVELTEKEIAKAGLEEGDLLFARRSLVAEGAGKCSLVCEVNEPTTFESSIIRARPVPSKVDSHFLYYLFSSPFGKYILGTIRRTVAVSGITGKDLVTLEIPIPPLLEQRAIASILGALDDKIELNHRMNATLESLARAIFKSWFVDFDPVKINAGQMPADGYDRSVLSLFPSTFQGSGIPEAWQEQTLGDVVEIFDSRRVPLSKKQRAERQGDYPYYGAASVMDYVNDFLFEGVYVLMGEDGSVVNDDGTPVLQYVWGQFWVNNHAHVLKGTNGISDEHLLLQLQHSIVKPFVTGAVQPKINQGNLKRIPFLTPTADVADAFSQALMPLFAQIRANTKESETLTKKRDALLPLLLSGDLAVDAFLEQA